VRKKIVFSLLILFFLLNTTVLAHELPLQAYAAILVEQTTGQVLYARNAHIPMYPASTTKMLTALVAMQHLDMDTIVVVGPEIRNMPAGFATNLHVEGETIAVEVLLKALLIRSSNEAGRILALETIRTIDNNPNITYAEAKPRFSRLMNDRARALGALNTNFNNPYGLHSEFHVTTAYDLAIIGRAFMAEPTLAEISAMPGFVGDSLGGRSFANANVRDYSWTNTNQMLLGAPFFHPYVTGGRTGFTTPAGHCFVGGAYHNGLGLVAVVLYSQEPDRWADTRMLLDYGFFNYAFTTVATDGMLLKTVEIQNPRLGDPYHLDIHLYGGQTALLNRAQDITHEIIFDPIFLYPYMADTLRGPIEEGDAVGTVVFSAGGETIFTAPAVAARAVYERTFDSDMDYYMSMILDNIFTRRALPYWIAFVGTVLGFVGIALAISQRRRAKREANWHPTRRR